jgi:predicted tellurium resistance membrane protein TerC
VSTPEVKEADGDANYLAELVEIVMVSAAVLMAVLLIQFGTPIVKEILRAYGWLHYGKLALFYVVAVLMFAQLHAVFRVILANYYFLSQLRMKNTTAKIDIMHK